MLEIGGRLYFLDEPIGPKNGGKFGPQDLHRHLAVVFQILGEIDRGHAARAEFFLDGVAVGKSRFEAVEGVGHEGLRCSAMRLLGSPGLTSPGSAAGASCKDAVLGRARPSGRDCYTKDD